MLALTETFDAEKYPAYITEKYKTHGIVNVDRTLKIPYDFKGIMGVPITFLDK